ncbi:MAG: hypothetical protein IPP71_07835 [Bacteroidetes bacterium]|nr:hypothetical protein [Bacteroidota bacterium]
MLNELSDSCRMQYDYESALKYAKEAESLSNTLNYKEGLSNSYFRVGRHIAHYIKMKNP